MAGELSAIIKELGAYPVSIVLWGIIVIIATLPKESRNLWVELAILLIVFVALTIFNTHYFRWFRKKN